MNTEWSLKELYTSFDSEEFIEDYNNFKVSIEEIKKWSETNLKETSESVLKIEYYINFNNEFEKFFKLLDFVSLTLSVDTMNEKAIKLQDVFDELLTELTEPTVVFENFIKHITNLDELIESSKILKEHSFYLNKIKEAGKYLLSDKEEILLAKLQNTGSNAWSKLSEQLTSNLLIDIEMDGEKKQLPLSIVRNLASEPDAALRKKAYEAELKAYEKIDKSMSAALNGIKGEVLTVSKTRGYKSPLDMTLQNSDMDMETLDAMFSAIKDSLPQFEKYFLKKAELLGEKEGLPFYDLFAPVGIVSMKYTYEEAAEFVIKNFSNFSKKMGDFAKKAFENRWIDVLPKEGKRGGAFCSNLHHIGESRILTNFTGTLSDVTTLAHELGHAYHGDCLKSETFLNSDYSMPIAETASTFCETIVMKAALKVASKEEALVILENDISGMAQVIVDIYSRFLFEDEVFKLRVDGSLSVRELKLIMEKAQKTAYGKGLSQKYLHSYMWLPKPHYYYADSNYYNFPYAYGLLFAKGLYGNFLEKGEIFNKEYDTILSATGKNNLRSIAALAGIEIRDKKFWKSSLDIVLADIEEFVLYKS